MRSLFANIESCIRGSRSNKNIIVSGDDYFGYDVIVGNRVVGSYSDFEHAIYAGCVYADDMTTHKEIFGT